MPLALAGVAASVAAAGVSAGLQSTGSGTKNATTSSAPWGPQEPYLNFGLQQAQQLYQYRQQQTLPTQYYQPENQQQRDAISATEAAGMQAPASFAPWSSVGNTLAGNAGAYSQNANSIASGGLGPQSGNSATLGTYGQTGLLPGQISTFNNGLAGSLNGAAQSGMSSLGQGASLASQVGSQALDTAGNMGTITNSAGAYANAAPLQAQIDAANADVQRELGQNSLTGIRQAAMSAGNANSSREGALEAQAINNTAEQMANTAATIRGNAFNTGAGLASNQLTNGFGTALGAANSLNSNGNVASSLGTTLLGQQQQNDQFNTASRVGALGTSGAQDLGYQTANTNAMLQGNQQLGQGLTIGQAAQTTGLSGTLGGLQAAYGAGTDQQQQDQIGINEGLASWNAQDQRTQNLLNSYWNIVGGKLGSQGTSSESASPSLGGIFGSALGGGLATYNLGQNQGWWGGASNAGTNASLASAQGLYNPLTGMS